MDGLCLHRSGGSMGCGVGRWVVSRYMECIGPLVVSG